MDIAQERDGDVVIVRLSGRLDASAATASEGQLLGTAAGESPRVAIDMSALSYISSAGLRVLLGLAKQVKQRNGKVALGGLVANVREVFTVTGFDTILDIEPDPAAAVAAVR